MKIEVPPRRRRKTAALVCAIIILRLCSPISRHRISPPIVPRIMAPPPRRRADGAAEPRAHLIVGGNGILHQRVNMQRGGTRIFSPQNASAGTRLSWN